MPEPTTMLWRAALLGSARVEGPDGPVERLRTRAAFALLVYLLLNRSRSHGREELADRFWPNDDPEASRGKLRLALHSIRSVLGPLVEADRHSVWIARPEAVQTDRDEFLRLAALAGADRESRLERAIALYKGPFLPGFYDDWAVEERERLETTAARALREVAEGHAAAERWPLALDAAGRLVALEPYDEAAHVLVLRGLRALGRQETLARTLEWTRERFAEVGSHPGEAIEAFAREPSSVPEEPVDESALLGREADLVRTLREIEASPVVTIWGPPGVGKTRLAREAVRALGRHPAFVSAVGLASVEALRGALRPALGGDAAASLEDLAAVVAPCLLVIDNLESLPDEAILLFADLRALNPGLRFLFTSQRRSGLEDEVVVALAPLPVPPEGASVAQVAASVSVRLLRERARERGRRLRVDEANASALATLCRRLEGVPLALELAAEWLDVMGPADILDRLDESGRRLDARLPGRDPRHRSLETAIAASLGRLDEGLRSALRALATFLGGWDLDAAEAVLGETAAGTLAELESRALVKVEEAGGRVRYAMLESIRLLVTAATPQPERAAALRRHADHFAQVGRAMEADPTSLVDQYRADDENVRQAAETILATEPDPERAARAIGGFQGYWQKLGRWELAEWSLRRAIDGLPPGPSPVRGSLHIWLGYVGFCKDDLATSESNAAACYANFAALDDSYRKGRAAGALGYSFAGKGDFEGALPYLREYVDATRRCEATPLALKDQVYALLILGETLLFAGREEGWGHIEDAMRQSVEIGLHPRTALACATLGWHRRLQGRPEEARPYLQRAVVLYQGTDEPFRTLTAQAHFATTLADLGDLDAARAQLSTATALAYTQGRHEGYAAVAEAAAWTAFESGDAASALRLLAAARQWRRRTRALSVKHLDRLDRLDAALRAATGREEAARQALAGETASRTEILADVRRVARCEDPLSGRVVGRP